MSDKGDLSGIRGHKDSRALMELALVQEGCER